MSYKKQERSFSIGIYLERHIQLVGNHIYVYMKKTMFRHDYVVSILGKKYTSDVNIVSLELTR